MGTYKSKYSGVEIDQILNNAQSDHMDVADNKSQISGLNQALTDTKKDLQHQINTLVLESGGDSNLEVVNARADMDSHMHGTLNDRLESDFNKKADKSTVESLQSQVSTNTTKTVDLQSQIDSLVIGAGGDSNPEVIQARTDENGTTHDTLKARIDSGITDLKSDLKHKYTRMKPQGNLYNSKSNMIGKSLKTVSVGQTVLFEDDQNFITSKIVIEEPENVSFKYVRMYSITDDNDIITKGITYINPNETITVESSNFSKNSHLYISAYEYQSNIVGVNYGDTVIDNTKYTEGLYKNDEKLIDGSNIKKLSSETVATEKEVNNVKLESIYIANDKDAKIRMLKSGLNDIENNVNSLYSLKVTDESSTQNITLKNSSRKTLLMHLHRTQNNGYDTSNDVFLEKGNTNFSDVRITSNLGHILNYRTLYHGNIEVLPDRRFGFNATGRGLGFPLLNSHNEMLMCYNSRICKSLDYGCAWTPISAFGQIGDGYVVYINSDDSVLLSKAGKMYKSAYPYTSYTEVLDITENYTGCFILPENIAEYSDGSLFLGSYQMQNSIRIYKSTDKGSTWTKIFEENGKYQHVHHLSIDKNVTPNVIYAGTDGGGGIYKSTDGGVSWTELRSLYPNIPHSTDCGLLYSDAETGYRYFGGETSTMKGGYSILRTKDDINFEPVCGVGNGVYFIEKLDGKLIACATSTRRYRCSMILMSDDKGKTWKSIYTTSPIMDTNGASDGFRYLKKYIINGTEQLIAMSQSASRPCVRIVPNNKLIYSEILVEVPDGVTSITVESGYACSKRASLYNNYDVDAYKIFDFPLNENNNVICERSTQKFFEGTYEFDETGKHISGIYPYVSNEEYSMVLSSLNDINVKTTFDMRNITISFWANAGGNTVIDLIKNESAKITFNKYSLYLNNVNACAWNYPIIPLAFNKFDLVIDYQSATIKTYVNGVYVATASDVDIQSFITLLNNQKEYTVLDVISSTSTDTIQGFRVYNKCLAETEISDSYNLYITDNQI